MVFSSLFFIVIFLPLFLLTYFSVKNIKIKNVIILLFSLLFYAWGEPLYIFIMILSIFITYFSSLIIDKVSRKYKKISLAISVTLILSILFIFKYHDFFVSTINAIFHSNFVKNNLPLPIGISFYTFQAISYVCDVYKEKIKAQKNIFNLALYISMFPQLIAGPIVRYTTIENALKNRVHSLNNFVDGFKRFIIGLSKKVLLANNMALIADTIFRFGLPEGTIMIYIGAICYALQLYYDFGGYSDMAIGLAKIMGFEIPENFNYPFVSKSFTEFWRRWHISLSTWFKDYVYIPLGGSRVGSLKHIRNMLIVWILTGLWHGAGWNFLAWGLFNCFILILEKYVFKDLTKRIPGIVSNIITIYLFIVGLIIFRANNINELFIALQHLVIYSHTDILGFFLEHASLIFSFYTIIPAILFSYPLFKNLKINNPRTNLLVNFGYIILLLINISALTSITYNPFIYFRY